LRTVDIRQDEVVKNLGFFRNAEMAAPGTIRDIGSARHLRGWDERRRAIAQAADKAGQTHDLLTRHGIECPTITGPAPAPLSSRPERRLYRIAMRLLHLHGCRFTAAISTATVLSRPIEDRAIVDVGLKALIFGSGAPLVCAEPAATYERGRLAVSSATNRLGLGRQDSADPRPLQPAVNLYDWYVGVRDNRVEQLWPITARGVVY
jgi:3-hydroxy-D-aspartate aldolase